MKHGVEVHPLPNDIHHQQQAGLGEIPEAKVRPEPPKTQFSSADDTFYLKPKLVEEVVDKVFDKVDDANIQVLASDVVEDDSGCRR